MSARKVVLAVIDALSPEAFERAVADGVAPTLAAIKERGTYVSDCVSVFPSVTPVAASAITTGLGPDEHLIPSMNWYHRGEERYVEYGSSFGATRTFGVFRSLWDTVYNMNLAHLAQDRRTVFEHLDDAGLRTACTTYLIYRGRFRHEPSRDSRFFRLAEAAQFRHAVWGARELFYADLFDNRATGCESTLGMPGQRDRHAGCVAEHLVEHDLFDFLLLSLPDNDSFSHREGPEAQPLSIAEADRAIDRMMQAGGGVERFLDEHAVIVMSDHSQHLVERSVNLAAELSGWRLLGPADPAPDEAEIAVCPAARSAAVYVLDRSRSAELAPRLGAELCELDCIDFAMWREDGRGVVRRRGKELRFEPGEGFRDARGASWAIDGDPDAVGLTVEDYPDAFGRLWSALSCPRAGEVQLSAVPGVEFMDWGGADHVGGGSHGSLHRCDSLGVLLTSGINMPPRDQWHIRDVTPMILAHFGLEGP